MPIPKDTPQELDCRFGLDEREVALLVSTYIADGRWHEMELTEDQGADYLEDFIKLWNPNSLGIPFGTAVFCQTQNTHTYGRDWHSEAQALTERDESGRTYDILDVQFT